MMISSALFWSPVVCDPSISSPKPLDQFQQNLSQSVKGFKIIQMKVHTLFQRGDWLRNSENTLMLCTKFDWFLPSAEEDFYFVNIFSLSRIYLPFEKGVTLHKYLNSLHPRILCAKFGWKWSRGSGEYF